LDMIPTASLKPTRNILVSIPIMLVITIAFLRVFSFMALYLQFRNDRRLTKCAYKKTYQLILSWFITISMSILRLNYEIFL